MPLRAAFASRTRGWLEVEITKVDYEGVADGGATYCIKSHHLDGEVETVRSRLSLTKPTDDEE